jgi:hypothetical protein
MHKSVPVSLEQYPIDVPAGRYGANFQAIRSTALE